VIQERSIKMRDIDDLMGRNVERELLPIEVLHCENRHFRFFGSSNP